MGFQSFISHIALKYLVVPRAPRVLEGKKHLACIGDSITYGAGVPQNREKSNWAYHLGEKLGNGWQVLNYGISGRTAQAEGDYPYTAEKLWGVSHEVRADAYIIMLGTNDAKPYNWDEERYARELKELVESYVTLPNRPRVILMTPPSCFPQAETGKVGFDIDGNLVSGAIYRAVQNIASELGLCCIDLNAFTAGHPEWFTDGVHPNYEGNRAVAEYIYDNLSL